MRWLGFALWALLVLIARSALAPRLELFGTRPDWLFVFAIFLGLYARRSDAIIGAWILGACADLMTLERLGFLALSYGFAAYLVVTVREYLFRYHWQTQFLITLILGLLIRLVWGIYRLAMYPDAVWTVWSIAAEVIVGAVYTAAFAPPIHKLFLSMPRLLGLSKPRYSFSGPRTVEGSRV